MTPDFWPSANAANGQSVDPVVSRSGGGSPLSMLLTSGSFDGGSGGVLGGGQAGCDLEFAGPWVAGFAVDGAWANISGNQGHDQTLAFDATLFPSVRIFTGEDCDRFLFDRIWKNELPGVLNRALAGYRRVLKRQANFDPPPAVLNATKRWLQQANPLPAFIEAECTKKPDAKCMVKDFYDAYSQWTRSMGYTLTQTQQTVDRNLSHLGFATKKGNQGKMIIGLALNNHPNSIPQGF